MRMMFDFQVLLEKIPIENTWHPFLSTVMEHYAMEWRACSQCARSQLMSPILELRRSLLTTILWHLSNKCGTLVLETCSGRTKMKSAEPVLHSFSILRSLRNLAPMAIT